MLTLQCGAAPRNRGQVVLNIFLFFLYEFYLFIFIQNNICLC